MEPIVEIRDVTAWRGDTRVFDGLTLELEAGCHTVVLGPNGAGKSTLLRLITREIHPVPQPGSRMRLFGRERWNVWDLRTRLGAVSHELQADYPDRVTGRDVVLSGYRSSRGTWGQTFSDAERRRTEAVLERLGVDGLADRRYAALSTGEQRRFLLGRALVHDPDVLLMDEPTNGLDLKASFEYLALVRRLMAEGKTVILATHHLHEIPPEIGRAVLLKEGRVVADGPKAEVLTSRRLSDLYGTPVEVVRANGFLRAVPGESTAP